MLKRLELVGFKSFADKTQFEFPHGITAIVGPNGSGKSNIVDAVRWVLGEQSAKSLRGGEMADVIFNGSATRRGLGMAEVTMSFDNSRRHLAIEADEVQITRRVYQDGQGEYLINQQLGRLKDIKDLFLGSGAGTDAYCIIEQGRVDVLLQASTKDRRTIFEEAAGISRFKAKKLETQRKLERVDLNVLRLKDVLDEVDKQLRSVNLQAAKAKSYQEYSERLKQIRVTVSLRDYDNISRELAEREQELAQIRIGLDSQTRQVESWEQQVRQLEQSLASTEDSLRSEDAEVGRIRQEISSTEASLRHEQGNVAEMEGERVKQRNRQLELVQMVERTAVAVELSARESSEYESQASQQRATASILEAELATLMQAISELQRKSQEDKSSHLDIMRQAARLQNDTITFKSQLDTLRREQDRLRQRTEHASDTLASVDLELKSLKDQDEDLQAKLNRARQRLSEERGRAERLRAQAETGQQRLSEIRSRRSGLAGRVDVLEGLERSREGLDAGVRTVLELRERSEGGPWQLVEGILADFLTVKREYAPLLDLALGPKAQRFVVRDRESLFQLLSLELPGRASFVSRDSLLAPAAAAVPKPAHSGILFRADELAQCDRPSMEELPRALFGTTFIVKDLTVASELATAMPGCRFVTLAGELLDGDGTITVGAYRAEAGILSRKSELRELREQLDGLTSSLGDTERELESSRDHLARTESHVGTLQQEIEVLQEQMTELRSRLLQHKERRKGLLEEVTINRSEIKSAEQEVLRLDAAWREAKAHAEGADRTVMQLQAGLEATEQALRRKEQDRQNRQPVYTTAMVSLAQAEERLAAHQARQRQLTNDLEQRRRDCQHAKEQSQRLGTRIQESQLGMLRMSEMLASAYLAKEERERGRALLVNARDKLRQERADLNERVQTLRDAWLVQQEQAHTRELGVQDQRLRRAGLVDRLREDYQLELDQLHALATAPLAEESPLWRLDPHLDVDAANREAAELRRKISRLGNVNLEALNELVELEARATALKSQYDDLCASKRALEEIIGKIDRDSILLFTEAFNTIKGHFQELFRKLFGGGMADVVLEQPDDVLESGIEIVARPPGKELRSISLLSGGEKTLTAVALLLAIFRSKPSPFCLLDEVDAALDEANVGRLASVLREFLDRSHFIIITHSKRTMACADVLYGITMQESGVSKRVAVRFEDWPDDPPVEPVTVPVLAAS